MIYIFFIIPLILFFFYILNKNKKGNPKLLEKRTKNFEEFVVAGNSELIFKEILRFAQVSRYTIDHVNNETHQLILNYVPKMGEQTNGSFFPIWISSLEDGRSSVCVGVKDKSSISMSFEEKNALKKLLPLLQSSLYSLQIPDGNISNQGGKNIKGWIGERDLSNKEYQIFLVKKYDIEKNDVLSIFIADGKSYETIADALSAAHEKDLVGEIQAKNLITITNTNNEKNHISENFQTTTKISTWIGIIGLVVASILLDFNWRSVYFSLLLTLRYFGINLPYLD